MYRLILVDDEPYTCEILSDFIEQEDIGFKIDASFSDGRQAWEYIQTHPVDCLITDIKMPYMDGIDLVREIHNSKKNIKIILLSAYGEFSYAQQGIKYGVTDYQLKPIDFDKLSETLTKIKIQMDREERGTRDQLKPEEVTVSSKYSDAAIELALRYIEKNFAEPISREDVATACFMNPSYFGRCFKKHTGQTFTDYLTNFRVQKSIDLLHKRMSVEEISKCVGYGSSRHFTRAFKTVTGYTPKEYRICILKQVIDQ